MEELRSTSPKRTGRYAKGWAKIARYENSYAKCNTVFNKKSYQLTHLLEDGHDLIRNNVKIADIPAYPHIKSVEKNVMERLEAKIEEAIQNEL